MVQKRGIRVALGLSACALVYPAIGWATARYLTRRARPPFEEPPPPGYEGLRLEAADGTGLGAWWRAPEEPRAVVVLAHGNGASRGQMRGIADALARAGCAVLPLSLRAHGDSGGERNDIGLSARRDVVAGVDEARRRLPGVPVAVYGSSLGAAAALFAAEELGARVDAYLLVAPYADLRVAVRRRTRRYLPPILDQLAYGALRVGGPLALPELDRIRPVVAARGVPASARVILVAGAADDRAPASDAEAIAARIPGARVRVVPGLDHEDLDELPAHEAWADVLATLDPGAE